MIRKSDLYEAQLDRMSFTGEIVYGGTDWSAASSAGLTYAQGNPLPDFAVQPDTGVAPLIISSAEVGSDQVAVPQSFSAWSRIREEDDYPASLLGDLTGFRGRKRGEFVRSDLPARAVIIFRTDSEGGIIVANRYPLSVTGPDGLAASLRIDVEAPWKAKDTPFAGSRLHMAMDAKIAQEEQVLFMNYKIVRAR